MVAVSALSAPAPATVPCSMRWATKRMPGRTVVFDGGDLMQTSMAVTTLAQHFTTWSPGLLEYSPDEVRILKIDKPYDGENWLRSVDDAR